VLNITASRRGKGKGLELNITPLIDMVFIMLIFFIVTTSFVKETGVDIQRPTAATAISKDKVHILIGVTADDRIFMDRHQMELQAVRINVERALAENPDAQVVVVADKLSSTGTAIAVMDGCRLAGAKDVSLAARREGD
jgi:biopolymer transport protein ExbD